MFQQAFSFEGRIRRFEYALSLGFYLLFHSIAHLFLFLEITILVIIVLLLLVPFVWFILAQSVKRSHDLGNSGWYILIPFYIFWLLFKEGNKGDNVYGKEPERIKN